MSAPHDNRHARLAEALVDGAKEKGLSSRTIDQLLASAQVYATLALVEETRTLAMATLGASSELGAMGARQTARRRLGL